MRHLAATSTVASLALCCAIALTGCTASPAPAASPAPSTSSTAAPSVGGNPRLPGCDAVTTALGSLLDGLSYSKAVSDTNTAQEAYEQSVCVYVTADSATQIGVTIAAIPFLQTELDTYGALPNAIADPRVEPYGAVLQTFKPGDGDDGHLDSALYLFDTRYSITIQGLTKGGSTATTLPQLSVTAAEDAAFAVRALID